MIEEHAKEEQIRINELISRVRELETQLNQLITKRDSISQNIVDIQAKIVRLAAENVSLTKFFKAKEFNFFEKYLFKRKEYKQFKQDEKRINETKEKNRIEKQECEDKNQKLLEEKRNLEAQIAIIQSRIKSYDVTQLLKETELLKSEDNRKIIEYLINKNPNLANNVEFMQEAILLDPNCIQFDKTNNEELYKLYISKKIEQIQGDHTLTDEEKSILIKPYKLCSDELESPKIVEKGKYKIPHLYLLEELRKNEKSITNGSRRDFLAILSGKPIYGFNPNYFRLDGFFDHDYGTQMQKWYEDENNLLAIHGSNTGKEDSMERVMRTGLRGSDQGEGQLDFRSTAVYKPELSFFKALEYRTEQYCAILLIPKEGLIKSDNPKKIWGKKEKDSGDPFVLPQYVCGYMTANKTGSRKIIINDHSKDEQYPYTFFNSTVEPKQIDENRDNR